MSAVVYPALDTSIETGSPGYSYPTTSVMYVEHDDTAKALMVVVLPPSAPVTSAKLYCRVSAKYGVGAVMASRVLRTITAGANWTTYDGTNLWTTPGCGGDGTDHSTSDAASATPGDAGTWMAFDVTAQVAAASAGGSYTALLTGAALTSLELSSSESAYSPYLSITVTLAAPADLTATPQGSGVVRLSWTKNPTATGYEIYSGGVTNPTRLLTTLGDVATYDHTTMPGVHHYRIRAISSAGYDPSDYTADASGTATGTPEPQLLFGNGVTAGTHSTDAVSITAHSGVEYPDLELPVTEYGVVDGGTLWGSRSKMRRMSLALNFGVTKTRAEVAALFSPGVTRTLASPRGSLSYLVESLKFADQNLTLPVRVSLALVSDLAYPEADELTETLTPGLSVDSYSEVDCDPKFTIAADASGTSLILVTDAGVTTIAGAIDASGVIVIDSEHHTVTYDGLDALDWFDRAGVWPHLAPGLNTIEAFIGDAPHPVGVEWRPRLLGLF